MREQEPADGRHALRPGPNLKLPPSQSALLAHVRLAVSPADGMLHGNDDHYLSCGASALNVVTSALRLANAEVPKRILDFGAGAGRVTRWFQAAFPDAAIETCDLRESDVAFCRDGLGVDAWTSVTDPDALQAPSSYDVIWAGSVFTHLSAEQSERILDKWLSWTNPLGIVVASLHGRRALDLAESGLLTYIDAENWAKVVEGYHNCGYGYADYPQTPGYGVSLTSLAWIAGLIDTRPDVRLVTISESAWDGHQDVVAIQRTA